MLLTMMRCTRGAHVVLLELGPQLQLESDMMVGVLCWCVKRVENSNGSASLISDNTWKKNVLMVQLEDSSHF